MAQLVEYCRANAGAMSLNPVEALKFFLGLICNCLMFIILFSFVYLQFTLS